MQSLLVAVLAFYRRGRLWLNLIILSTVKRTLKYVSKTKPNVSLFVKKNDFLTIFII